jgi:biotin-[acetyl-CoA-carboxylase] ligase BirA-like protein
LLVAEHQSAGRGRQGRNWHSAAGASLTFSLGLPLQPADWSGLSLAVGVSLAESLAPQTREGDQLQLKWPNDLWFKDCKLGGILVETASWGDQRYVVIGVGLNVMTPAQTFENAAQSGTPPGAAATSLQALWPEVDAPWALHAVAAPLVAAVLAFEREGFAPFQARFAARDALAGRRDSDVVLESGQSFVTPQAATYFVSAPLGWCASAHSFHLMTRSSPRCSTAASPAAGPCRGPFFRNTERLAPTSAPARRPRRAGAVFPDAGSSAIFCVDGAHR